MTPRTHSPKNGESQYPAENYLNRELGILAFNSRVLAQAKNPATPLLERLRYICIVSSNLDEFFEIRVAGLKEQVKLHSIATTPDGLAAQTALGAGRLLMESGEDAAVLRERVTSKGGTTFAALETFRAHNFEETVMAAVRAAAARSRELGK